MSIIGDQYIAYTDVAMQYVHAFISFLVRFRMMVSLDRNCDLYYLSRYLVMHLG